MARNILFVTMNLQHSKYIKPYSSVFKPFLCRLILCMYLTACIVNFMPCMIFTPILHIHFGYPFLLKNPSSKHLKQLHTF